MTTEADRKWERAAKIIADANRWYDGRCQFCNQTMPKRTEQPPPEEVKRREDLLKTISANTPDYLPDKED